MNNQRTCCGNCANKIKKKLGADGIMLYCDIKRRRINSDGLCQWYEREKHERL